GRVSQAAGDGRPARRLGTLLVPGQLDFARSTQPSPRRCTAQLEEPRSRSARNLPRHTAGTHTLSIMLVAGALAMRSSRLGVIAPLVLSLVTSAGAQAPVPEMQTTESRGLRITWTVEPQTRDFTAVCGHIYNDQRVSARNVSLLVQGVDGDRVVS